MRRVAIIAIVAASLNWNATAAHASNLQEFQKLWEGKANTFDVQESYGQCLIDMEDGGAAPITAQTKVYACADAALALCVTPASIHGLSQWRCIDEKVKLLAPSYTEAAEAEAKQQMVASAPTIMVTGKPKNAALASLHQYTEVPVCRSIVSTGTRFAHKECHTAFEWREISDDAQEYMKYLERSESFAR